MGPINNNNANRILKLVILAILFYWALHNWAVLVQGLSLILAVLSPFLLGGLLAFVINVPMRWFEKKLQARTHKITALNRALAFMLTLICVASVMAFVILIIVPGMVDAVVSLSKEIPKALNKAQIYMESQLPQIQEFLHINIENIKNMEWDKWSAKIKSLLENGAASGAADLFFSGMGLVGGLLSGVTTFVIGLVLAVYILIQKEELGRQIRRFLYAFIDEKKVDKILAIFALSDRSFARFLSGQCLDAAILGLLFFISMSIFDMPYALLVGVLIAFCALIPVVGAFIGFFVGLLLIAVVAPIKALGFVILFIVLQQIEGNLIYPKIVGNSVGLPSIWVFVAVIMGGKLMGILGMLLFIPLFSVLYSEISQLIKIRLGIRNIAAEKWENPPLLPQFLAAEKNSDTKKPEKPVAEEEKNE